jgi:hypothetical protein
MLSQAAKAAKQQAVAAKQQEKQSRLLLLGPRVLVGSGRQRLLLEAKHRVAAAAGSRKRGLMTVAVIRKMMTLTTVIE